MVIGSPESGNDKTPMATPRLEKKDLFMTSSIHVKTSPFPTTLVNASTSSSTPSSSTSQALSPTSKDSESQLMLSGTSPTGSTHSKSASNGSGSNDITPMPTPRAGSPIAGLRMTPSTTILPSSNSFATHSQQSLQDFKLSDSTSFTLRSSSLSPRKESHQKIGQKKDYSSITDDNDNVENDILKVSPVVNVLALGGLLDDTLSPAPPHHREYTPSPASSVGSAVPSLSTTTGSSPEPDNSSERVENNVGEVGQLPDEDRLDTVSSKVPPNDRNDADVEAALISSDDNANEEEEEEDFDETDFDKTPTLHTSMELPKSNDTTTHALNARYRKKRTVGIPHVTARKRVLSISSSKKNKKS